MQSHSQRNIIGFSGFLYSDKNPYFKILIAYSACKLNLEVIIMMQNRAFKLIGENRKSPW
jgi:hypothetical protein